MDSSSSNNNTKKKIKFVCLSDTHTKTENLNVPKGDVLIHSGDFTLKGSKHEIEKFSKFLKTLDFKHKIIIAGNHDLSFDEEYKKRLRVLPDHFVPASVAREILYEGGNITYLENSSTELYGYKIWGSPCTPEYYNWAFMHRRGNEIKKVWDMIPDDTDILITHGPPFQILDRTVYDESVGCEELTKQVLERIKPMYHIFGHIHESNGVCKIGDTNFINAAVCDITYKPNNEILTFELDDRS